MDDDPQKSRERGDHVPAFAGKACWYCLATPKAGKSLKKCSGCRVVAYCGSACAKLAWPHLHKRFCSILAHSFSQPNRSRCLTAWVKHANLEGAMCSLTGGPAVASWVKYLWLWRPHCEVCFAVKPRGEEDSGHCAPLTYCHECFASVACAEHREEVSRAHTEKACAMIKSGAQSVHFRRQHRIDYGEGFLYTPEVPLEVARDVWPNCWKEYYEWRAGADTVPLLPPQFFTAASRELSMVATVASALYDFGIAPDVTGDLIIHVLAATPDYELCPTPVWEELNHVFPGVKRLEVWFIRSDVPKVDDGKDLEVGMCPDCTAKGKKRVYNILYEGYKQLLHRPPKHFKTPTIVVGFNTGMYEGRPEWTEDLRAIASLRVPAVFTSFNKMEARGDAAIASSCGLRIIDGPKPNPFACMEYIQDASLGLEDEVLRSCTPENPLGGGGIPGLEYRLFSINQYYFLAAA